MRKRTAKIISTVAAGWACGLVALPAATGQFTSFNVELKSHINLATLGATSGNDCWGYTSPSGREYALMGVRNAMVVVEITDPANPVIVDSVPHTNTLWGDIKTYQNYAYVVNDNGGGGMDVVDMSDVDSGSVDLVQSVTIGGLSTSHNVAIDADSGYLYLCGADINGGRLVAYSLANPANPTFAGDVSSNQGAYVHDAQIVTYTSGPNAGKQIAFCANGGTGLDIYDVTSKSNMFRLSRTGYGNLAYAHQCWLSDDYQYLYLNDELDNVNETVVFDVSDLANPVVANTYNSGVNAYDHNQYYHNGFVFEAEYTAGVRIFCAADPVDPVQVGWFDTYPENDGGGFEGAWSCYPFFPSGTLIVSDINRGLFVLDPSEAFSAGTLQASYPSGRPEMTSPQGGTVLQVALEGSCGATVDAGTATLHYDTGSGFATVAMSEVAAGLFEAAFPSGDCGSIIEYYVSATSGGTMVTDPANAPAQTYSTIVANGEAVVLGDNFETDLGWVDENLGAISGLWERSVPVDDPDWAYDPATDSDGSGQAYLTQNELGNTDIDNGAVRITSPVLDMSSGNGTLSYDYYLRLTDESGDDRLLAEISSNGDAGPWFEVASHTTGSGVWRHEIISSGELVDAGIALTSTMKIRFTANDDDPQSIVEAGLDAFQLTELDCGAGSPGDIDGDGTVGILDLLALLAEWGACGDCGDCPADLDGDCSVGIVDVLTLLGNWG